MKPSGIAIHESIDGYSLRILWLKLSSINNNPKVILNYYLCCIKELNLFHVLSEETVELKMKLYAEYSDSFLGIITTARVKTKVLFMVAQQQTNK